MPKKRLSDAGRMRPRSTGTREGSHDDQPAAANPIPTRGRPPKRLQKLTSSGQFAAVEQTFNMKMFDRSLDLSKYSANTGLYPVCRAWFTNQPNSPDVINFKRRVIPAPESRQALPNLADDLRSGRVSEVTAMPANRNQPHLRRFPQPLPVEPSDAQLKMDNDTEQNNGSSAEANVSHEALLLALKKRSRAVRQNWLAHTRNYREQKCERSFQVLAAIYKQ